MTFRTLLFDVEGQVATVTLNRPEERNAIDDTMVAELETILDELESPEIRAVVVTGNGGVFCAGGQIARFEQESDPAVFRASSLRMSAIFVRLEDLEKPVIAAIPGVATGAGLQLALASDLRIASDDARIGMLEHRLGLIPAHGGATRLVKLIGLSRAKELYFRGELVAAAEARAMGLLHAVVPADRLLEEAASWGRDLASRAPTALGLAKRILNAAADADVRTSLTLEAFAQSVARGTEDHAEGVRAFREKRWPRFSGR